jgi:hypothetical protein
MPLPHGLVALALLPLLPLLGGAPAPPRAAQPGPVAKISDADLKRAAITLERGACYGPCPIYRVRIAGDGRVSFAGESFVRTKHPKPARIGRDAVRRLFAEFERADFFALPDVYSMAHCACEVRTDNPSATITLTWRGRTRTLEHDYGCPCVPPTFERLEAAVDSAARVRRWIGHGKEGRMEW